MKKLVFSVVLCLGMIANVLSQDWMTSLEVAKSLGLVQNKLLFVIWEDAYYNPYPVLIKDAKGNAVVEDMLSNDSLNEAIWKHFVPVVLSESRYEELLNDIKDKRPQSYIDKFNDDSIKIMDVNGNILNTKVEYYDYLDIVKFIVKYALDTSYLQAELMNFRTQKDFNTTFRLASKYMDFSVLVSKDLRKEVLQLSDFYLRDAKDFISEEANEVRTELAQKVELLNFKQELILNNPRKVLRRLKKIESSTIASSNEELWAFLHYTAYLLLKDESNASVWRTKVSLVNLKKANMIVNINS
ncbi:hypothetical protein AB9K26_01900 [Psychroserpens sp. XS_ASV72]|uniref:hypothetical protein n=1 Tax=Psychroserpens sp. XS_ASV72 TaxID=3241293 RepID=UPI003511DFDC